MPGADNGRTEEDDHDVGRGGMKGDKDRGRKVKQEEVEVVAEGKVKLTIHLHN